MSDPTPHAEPAPRWRSIADDLEARASHPTADQLLLAERIGVSLPDELPAPVAAVVLRVSLASALGEDFASANEVPEGLNELESQLGVDLTETLLTGTRAEVSAWYAARYMQLTAIGLRELQPEPRDVVGMGGNPSHPRIVSSIGADGRLYMKGYPPAKSWPNHLTLIAREGEAGHADIARAADAASRNAMRYSPANSSNWAGIEQYALDSVMPSEEGIRALEELLDSDERSEERFQRVLTAHPALLACLVVGNWKTYVIPKVRLGSEHVTDYLVLGINSLGPQWVAVEIEGQQHRIENRDGRLSSQTRHAVDQINDWREWLTTNVAYAHSELGLYGITNRVPGLVIIGRSDPSSTRAQARSRSAEEANITIHSWDWLRRNAENVTAAQRTDFALRTARELGPSEAIHASLTPRRDSEQG